MSAAPSPFLPHDRRIQAVLAMLHGDPVAQVSACYGIGRSALYKFRRRALAAISDALVDLPRGPKRPHNRVSADWEQKTLSLCELYPTLSARRIAERLGRKAPRPRTIQRIRKRHLMKKFPKRSRPLAPARKLTLRAEREVRNLLHEKFYLGPDRLTWDLLNSKGIRVSPSTFKRRKKKWGELVKFFAPPAPAWRFCERHHPHSLWHGDFLEKVTLSDIGQTAYQSHLVGGREFSPVQTRSLCSRMLK